MKTLIVYDSFFGNTEKIAQAIGGALGGAAVVRVSETSPDQLAGVDLLLVENVGNLVCTAGFDLGEHLRIVLLSVTEGDDKLIKYPAIFQRSDALVITKTDLLPYTNFRLDLAAERMRQLAPEASVFTVSALRRPARTSSSVAPESRIFSYHLVQ